MPTNFAKTQQTQNLLNKISDGHWMGKDYFPISNTVMDLINNPRESFFNLPQIRTLIQLEEDIERLNLVEVLDAVSPEIVQTSALRFLTNANSANQGYNSKVYPTVQAVQQKLSQLFTAADRFGIGSRELMLLDKAIAAHNSVLDLPKLSSIPQYGLAPLNLLFPPADPKLHDIVHTLKGINESVLKVLGMAEQYLPASWIMTGILTKSSSAAGELVARYELAGLLKGSGGYLLSGVNQGAVATITSGGTNAVWLLLMDLAPWIIAGAVIVGIALKLSEKKLKMGTDFYLFRVVDGEPAGDAHSVYGDLPPSQNLSICERLVEFFSQVAPLDGDIKIVVLDQDVPVLVYSRTEYGGIVLESDDEAIVRATWERLNALFFPPQQSFWEGIEWVYAD